MQFIFLGGVEEDGVKPLNFFLNESLPKSKKFL